MKPYKLVILISYLLQFIDRVSPGLSFILVLISSDLNPGIGFLYLRYVADPKTLWSWYKPYLKDDEECFLYLIAYDGRFSNSSVVHQHDSYAEDSLIDRKIQDKNWSVLIVKCANCRVKSTRTNNILRAIERVEELEIERKRLRKELKDLFFNNFTNKIFNTDNSEYKCKQFDAKMSNA
ncbi:hypothetical protein OROMI_002541 [Orobanche minor]